MQLCSHLCNADVLRESNMVLGSAVVDHDIFLKLHDTKDIFSTLLCIRDDKLWCGHQVEAEFCLLQQQMVLCKDCSEHLVW